MTARAAPDISVQPDPTMRDGVVRVGFAHFTTPDEVDRLLAELTRLE
jgi:selenocysteine lyase/cysteine desulfurase